MVVLIVMCLSMSAILVTLITMCLGISALLIALIVIRLGISALMRTLIVALLCISAILVALILTFVKQFGPPVCSHHSPFVSRLACLSRRLARVVFVAPLGSPWSHPPESEDLSQPCRVSPRATLAALVRIRGPFPSSPRGPEGTSCLHRALFVS
jgi:hypothetical protein